MVSFTPIQKGPGKGYTGQTQSEQGTGSQSFQGKPCGTIDKDLSLSASGKKMSC